MTPQFYITPAGMRDAEELTGDFAFGSAVQVAGDASKEAIARLELRRKVVARTQALVQVTLGLGWYRAGQLDEAAKSFAAADHTPNWVSDHGREVLYLFEGNVAGKQRDYRQAELLYRRALKLNPGYARAQLGLGEVYLHRAAPRCAPGLADVAGLQRAVAWFERAQRTPNPPPLSDVPTKAAFQIGRADVCLSQAGAADRWQTARNLFARVVHEYEAGNQRLRELAAESHFGLALIASPNPAPQDPISSLVEAATQCKQAIALSADISDRQQDFQEYLNQVNQALGRAGGAPRP